MTYASASPATAPARPMTALSISSCRAMRDREAPSAARTLISAWRRVARASSRLATFAQAMSSTKLTAVSRVNAASRTCHTTVSWRLRTRAVTLVLD